MTKVQLILFVGSSVFGGLLYLAYKRLRRQFFEPSQKDWQYVGTLQEIMMYPLKSCRGIELQEALCKKDGIKCGSLEDRQFVLVGEDDDHLFAGANPKMWKIQSKLIGDGEIEVTAPGMDPLVLNVQKLTSGSGKSVKHFDGYSVPMVECDSQYGNWFSKFLRDKESGLKLFAFINSRKMLFRKQWHVSPYMALVDESLRDLNVRLPEPIHHWQFRGNFVIKNTELPAFSEDNWKWMRIGNEAIFRYRAPCYRCILPNVNPFTSERSSNFEPLKTLKKYRMRPGKVEPEMGIYFNLHREGTVKLGDKVFVVM